VSDSKPVPPKRDLDELIAKFEDDVRKRPTPTEVAAPEPIGVEVPVAAPPTSTEPMPVPGPRSQPQSEPVPGPQPQPQSGPEPAPKPQLEPELELAFDPAGSAPPPAPAEVPAAAPAPTTPAQAPLGIEDLQTWWAGGERVEVELPGGGRYAIFTRVLGGGPWMTLVHGFPTSSWDWAPMAPALAQRYRLLTFDLLGFGDSDKPPGHDWSAFEQADIVEALWRHFGVNDTRVVAHDVGMTVALELLARQEDGRLATRVSDYTLLNGGVYTGFHRPRPIQVWLQRPVIGALIAQLMSEGRFGPPFAEIFGREHRPTAEDLHQHWESVARRNGSKNYHRLIKYIPERRANAARWEAAVEQSKTPIRFVWGMADPVSGAHMAEVVKERRPGADMVELADVGHYPQLEAPDRVAAAIIEGPPHGAAGTGPAPAKKAE
jgi:pimeloyl-ACP methyl ester carboxylesterase